VAKRDIVVIGASAGGVEALSTLVAALPADLPASVCVVLHVPADGMSVLPRILARAGPLPAVHPTDGQLLKPGTIYVAPPDRHLVLERDRVRLTRGPRENGHRPSVDLLFRSAARRFGARVVAVVLSGSGDDGTAGLVVVRRRGGVGVVQQPKDAVCASMPSNALEVAGAEYQVPASELGELIGRLVQEEVADVEPIDPQHGFPVPDEIREEYEWTEKGQDPPSLSGFTCPECGGRLWEIQEPEMIRYRCRVGHGYSPDSLLTSNTEALEGALWAALNALEEHASLTRRLADNARMRSHKLTASRFEERASDTERQAAILRRLLQTEQHTSSESLLQDDNADEIAVTHAGRHMSRPLPNAHGS
jgi:two-component system chemotaxis response regulator CheB